MECSHKGPRTTIGASRWYGASANKLVKMVHDDLADVFTLTAPVHVRTRPFKWQAVSKKAGDNTAFQNRAWALLFCFVGLLALLSPKIQNLILHLFAIIAFLDAPPAPYCPFK